jgi:hypothetical protein
VTSHRIRALTLRHAHSIVVVWVHFSAARLPLPRSAAATRFAPQDDCQTIQRW